MDFDRNGVQFLPNGLKGTFRAVVPCLSMQQHWTLPNLKSASRPIK